MKVKIAVVQFEVKKVSEEENLKRAEKFIKKAAAKGADIIVFPEDFVTRMTSDKIEFVNSRRHVREFQELAKKYKIDIVPGSLIVRKGLKKYNTTYYIDSKGKILSEYEKIHLWITERGKMKPGRNVSVFNTRYGKAGLIICWDLAFPEIFQRMANKKAEIIFCPSYWCYEDSRSGRKYDKNAEIKFVDSLCVERAFDNEVVIVFCNAAGKNGKNETPIGHSQVAVPFKGAIKKLNHNKEEMFVVEVDTSILKDEEKSYRLRKE